MNQPHNEAGRGERPHTTQFDPDLFRRSEQPPAPSPQVQGGPVSHRLNRELSRIRAFSDRIADKPTITQEEADRVVWAEVWRIWALRDVADRAAAARQVFVLHQGNATRYRLFTGDNGRHLLAVRPDTPRGELNYCLLNDGECLPELYSVYARMVDSLYN